MKFQLFSDIHLEMRKSLFKIPILEENLMLAGDIGKLNTNYYIEFLNYCSKNWKRVFYILGNHEYYSSRKDFNKLNRNYHDFFDKYENIYLLDNSCYEFENIKIIGSTLWSNPECADYFCDFTKIKEYHEKIHMKLGFSIKTFKELHFKSFEFLKREIENSDKKVIVITHFAPLKENTSHEKFKNEKSYVKNYFASNIAEDINLDNVLFWCYGHTHYSNIFDYKNTKMISNQIGYPDEKDVNYNLELIIEI